MAENIFTNFNFFLDKSGKNKFLESTWKDDHIGMFV